MSRLRKGVLLVVLVASAGQSPAALVETPSVAPNQPGPASSATMEPTPAPKQPRSSPGQFRFLPASECVDIGHCPQIETIFSPDLPAKGQAGFEAQVYVGKISPVTIVSR